MTMKVLAVFVLLVVTTAYAYQLSVQLAYDGLLQDNEFSQIFRVSEVEGTDGSGKSCGVSNILTDLSCIAKCQTRDRLSGICVGEVCRCVDH